MKKNIIVIARLFIAVAITANLTSCKKEKPSNGKPTIKIGAILPLSGNVAEPGIAAKNSLELMLEKLSKSNLKYNYKLIFEDNQMSPQKTATTTNKLLNMDKADALFSIWNQSGNVVAGFADQKGVFGFSCAYGDKSTIGKYNYNFASDLKATAEKLAAELKNVTYQKWHCLQVTVMLS